MRSAALQRLEGILQTKKLATTVVAPWDVPHVAVHSSGIPELDSRLGGGWRQGEVSELVGARSRGRTSVLVATLAAATSRGDVVALVDAVDRFDPISASAAGLQLQRLLWVRGPALTVEQARPVLVEQAVNRAIRAFDLIVRAGGFSVIVLDVADIPPRYLRALPFATWLRLAHANEGRRSAGLIVGQLPMGRSARGVSIELTSTPVWAGSSPQARRFGGFRLGP